MKYELDCNFINSSASASPLRNLKLDSYKNQHDTIEFEIRDHRIKYWDLEICDVVKFENWDSDRKVFGSVPDSDWYSIFDIFKYPDTEIIKIKCFKVSG